MPGEKPPGNLTTFEEGKRLSRHYIKSRSAGSHTNSAAFFYVRITFSFPGMEKADPGWLPWNAFQPGYPVLPELRSSGIQKSALTIPPVLLLSENMHIPVGTFSPDLSYLSFPLSFPASMSGPQFAGP